ncbi:uncharacterized protein LOC129235895 [Anastrepha obliqua]|uniref:uncharacterized protein LOC129235895 n=1 Tax=Anastrepha obliqua TaxID=95512 RepID=UPI00240979FF|nr:uncharacterized protein LOC129235895 [Anastrepha obliqua]
MSLSLQDTKTTDAVKLRSQRSSRRNRTQNLEKEVELIMSQEDDSEDEMSKEQNIPVTSKTYRKNDVQNQSLSLAKSDTAQTPRRSTRKSIKPVQEYEDIVGRRRELRSASKVGEEHVLEADEEPQAKWTPAKVGRVSQKRSRKNRRVDKNKSKLITSSENEDAEYEKDNSNLNSKFKEIDLIGREIKNVQSNDALEKNVKSAESVNTEKCEAANNLECEIIESEKSEETAEDNSGTSSRVQTVTESESEEFEAHPREDIIINVEENDTQEKSVENFIKDDGLKQQKDGFGNYLKNNYMDMSNLGLNPLIDEDVEKEEKGTNERKILEDKGESSFKKGSHATSENTEITVITINDDIENKVVKDTGKTSFIKTSEATEVGGSEFPVVTIDDDTLNNSDCMLVKTDAEDDMQPLRFSDDEISTSSPHKRPLIILTTDEGQQRVLNSTNSSNEVVTPKRWSKAAERRPTPFKPKIVVPDNEDDLDKDGCAVEEESICIAVSKIEPKEIVLRSIRKRSSSVCIGGAYAVNIRKNVTFYSPANQTTILEDLDMRFVPSLQQNTNEKSCSNETFITQRRKRSLSFDEALINKSKSRNQTPNKVGVTPQKLKPARTKLPNFAAIHQKNFGKMENIVDHVNRKAERAKILTNSSTKPRLASAQKTATIQQIPNNSDTDTGKSKAVKRINLTTSAITTVSVGNKAADAKCKDHHDSKLPMPRIGVCKPLMTTDITHIANRSVNLPNPRLGIIKPNTASSKKTTPAKNVLKPIQTRQVMRPVFNLSTTLQSSHVNKTKCTNEVIGPMSNGTSVSKCINVKPTNAAKSIDEKLASRRQRHMDMFKGRGANARTTPGTAEKNLSQLIRGVRSNRRFELQMAHRKNMEH